VKGESIMAYELLPAQENESGLFFRSDGEAAERCGVIGCMRADFGRTGKEFRTKTAGKEWRKVTRPLYFL
jgi:hypothetical protein